jgi:hypothetical protein
MCLPTLAYRLLGARATKALYCFNPLKQSDKYMCHLLKHSETPRFDHTVYSCVSHVLTIISEYFLKNLGSMNKTLGHGFHFQHRNSRTPSIESPSHDSGRTLVRAEYGYPKGSPNKSAATALNTVLASTHAQTT